MFLNLPHTPKPLTLKTYLSWLVTSAVLATAVLLPLNQARPQGPPPIVAALVHSQLPALHGQVLSLKYIEPLNSYRVRLQSPQGQILSFEQDARSGRLLGLQAQPALAGQLHTDLLPLEAILQTLFGKADIQLLAVELNASESQASYALDWIQEGASFHAHIDAHNGALHSPREA